MSIATNVRIYLRHGGGIVVGYVTTHQETQREVNDAIQAAICSPRMPGYWADFGDVLVAVSEIAAVEPL